jgi:hypothetical protein
MGSAPTTRTVRDPRTSDRDSCSPPSRAGSTRTVGPGPSRNVQSALVDRRPTPPTLRLKPSGRTPPTGNPSHSGTACGPQPTNGAATRESGLDPLDDPRLHTRDRLVVATFLDADRRDPTLVGSRWRGRTRAGDMCGCRVSCSSSATASAPRPSVASSSVTGSDRRRSALPVCGSRLSRSVHSRRACYAGALLRADSDRARNPTRVKR